MKKRVATKYLMKKSYITIDEDSIEEVSERLNEILACLRAQYLSYQTSHWQVAGSHFYQEHLLFERLYQSVQDEVDVLAEKISGLIGSKYVSLQHQVPMMLGFLGSWANFPDHIRRGLLSESVLQDLLKTHYDSLTDSGLMTLGLDDYLMATANSHEGNIYLLQQILNPRAEHIKQGSQQDVDASDIFYKDPSKVEVQQFAESNAITNDESTFKNTLTEDRGHDSSLSVEKAEFSESPPTPNEILELPGAKELSTLNRFVIESEDPELEPAIKMNEKRQAVQKVLAMVKDFNGYGYPFYTKGDKFDHRAVVNALITGRNGWATDESSFYERLSPTYGFLALRNAEAEDSKYVDPYTMYIVKNDQNVIVDRIGTHSRAKGIMKWLQHRKETGKNKFHFYMSDDSHKYLDTNKGKYSSINSKYLKVRKYILDMFKQDDEIHIDDIISETRFVFKLTGKEIQEILTIMMDNNLLDYNSSGWLTLI